MKVIFGKVGPFNWKNAVRLCIQHPAHAGYFVNRLWSYFVPVPPDPTTRVAARAALRPLRLPDPAGRDGDPQAPAALRGAADGQVAGRLHRRPAAAARRPDRDRATGSGSTRWPGSSSSTRRTSAAGTRRAGSTPRPSSARWLIARRALQKHAFNPDHTTPGERPPADPEKLVDRALGWWGSLQVSPHTRTALLDYATKTMAAAIADDNRQKTFPVMAYNALRHLAAVSPEMQTA